MGISLFDRETGDEPSFHINFWHWGAIVEAIRSTRALTDAQVDGLHEPFCGNGLTIEQARIVAAALRSKVIPRLRSDDWLGLDQSVSTNRNDGPVGGFTAAVERGEDLSYLYQTNRAVVETFANYCEACNDFDVL
jgi:hypothetical protein